jgi:hypothetical protein
VWLFLTDYVTYCVIKYSLLREFMNVSFKLLCPKNITFFKGIMLSDLGGGCETCMGRILFYVLVTKLKYVT